MWVWDSLIWRESTPMWAVQRLDNPRYIIHALSLPHNWIVVLCVRSVLLMTQKRGTFCCRFGERKSRERLLLLRKYLYRIISSGNVLSHNISNWILVFQLWWCIGIYLPFLVFKQRQRIARIGWAWDVWVSTFLCCSIYTAWVRARTLLLFLRNCNCLFSMIALWVPIFVVFGPK